jgi:hypothetical protein
MLVREIIEMTKEKPIAIIARDHTEIGEKKLRDILKDIGGHHQKGQKGWTFQGNPEDLEKSIYDFVQDGRKVKAATKEQKNKVTGDQMKIVSHETFNENTGEIKNEITAEQINKILDETKNEIAGETSQKRTRKRASFDIDIQALKKIKIHAVEEDMKVSDIVEIAIFSYIEQKKI